MLRIVYVVAGLLIAFVLVWHPPSAAAPAVVTTASPHHRPHIIRRPPHRVVAVVYVAGAVAHPGLYQVTPDARADDAVRLAGGLRRDADPAGVNLAAHVADGDEVLVPVVGQAVRRVRRRVRARVSPPPEIVELNSASAETLARVPGIGPTLAARIVALREQDGAYASLDELLDVAGMSQARMTRAEPYLRI